MFSPRGYIKMMKRSYSCPAHSSGQLSMSSKNTAPSIPNQCECTLRADGGKADIVATSGNTRTSSPFLESTAVSPAPELDMPAQHSTRQLELELTTRAYKQSSSKLIEALKYDLGVFACLMSNDRECVARTSKYIPSSVFALIRQSRSDLDQMEKSADRFIRAQGSETAAFNSMHIMRDCLHDDVVQKRCRDTGGRPPVLVRGVRWNTAVC